MNTTEQTTKPDREHYKSVNKAIKEQSLGDKILAECYSGTQTPTCKREELYCLINSKLKIEAEVQDTCNHRRIILGNIEGLYALVKLSQDEAQTLIELLQKF